MQFGVLGQETAISATSYMGNNFPKCSLPGGGLTALAMAACLSITLITDRRFGAVEAFRRSLHHRQGTPAIAEHYRAGTMSTVRIPK